MEDDLVLGASIWGPQQQTLSVSIPPPTLAGPSPAPSSSPDGFDDFDDFGTPAETVSTSGDEGGDEFGDFGDFGEISQAGSGSGFEPQAFEEEVQTPVPAADWPLLRLDPLPSREELKKQIERVMGPSWSEVPTSHFSDDPIRQIEGLGQTLVNAQSRQMYDLLLPATPSNFKPVNWTRSRIRRQHLITMGIPVNLDEVLPRAGTKLPTLEIHTRPTSAPPAPQTAPIPIRPQPPASHIGTPRSGTPQPGMRSTALATAQLRLGPKPEINENMINSLLNIDTDGLLLLPAKKLEGHLADMRIQTANTSALLTYLLQMRDALQQDSETYNKLIGELVSEAQKVKTGKRTGSIRRGSGAT